MQVLLRVNIENVVYKYTVDELCKQKIVICCDTLEKAKHFKDTIAEENIKWQSGEDIKDIRWFTFKEKTCYVIQENGLKLVNLDDISQLADFKLSNYTLPPEGVFYSLFQLEEGKIYKDTKDRIFTVKDGNLYALDYENQWHHILLKASDFKVLVFQETELAKQTKFTPICNDLEDELIEKLKKFKSNNDVEMYKDPNYHIRKYKICYNSLTEKAYVDWDICEINIGQVYFESEAVAQQALETFEELIASVYQAI